MRLGIDTLLTKYLHLVRGRRVGLITNHTGVNAHLESTIDLLNSHNEIELVALFGPEHGVRGGAQAGDKVKDSVDSQTGLPTYSLYGNRLTPTGAQLEGIEVLICDLQDLGCRFWTYSNTMAYSLAEAGRAGLDYLVLDRPNPLGGLAVEGNLVAEGFFSFVGGYPLPIRHGLTMGELAHYLNDTEAMRARLHVIPLEGWSRGMYFDETGLCWVPPSPNMPTVETAVVYPGTCLFEGTNLSEGRGTTKPFEWVGAPWLDGSAWARSLNSLGLPGVRFRPVYFTPTFHKHALQACEGVQIHVTDRQVFEPVRTGLHLVHSARAQDPVSFSWRPAGNDGHLHFDRLAGSSDARLALEREANPDEIMASWCSKVDIFRERREHFLLYPA